VGWRIDYFLVCAPLKQAVKAADIHANVLGSDHCPVSVTLA
jgi:exodeoxyribonuclease-3